MDIDKVIGQLRKSADFSKKQAEAIGSKDLEMHGYFKGQSEAFRSAALLLAKLTLDDTLANL
ncbi:hypothetical protein CON01_00735 [Bacillus thuringiensis]|uniref:Uncharacterized protein n=1 Tax=Bacillus thuringiensis TaxID=1428 RepID=A0A9X6YJ06_BACTU|nr:hypothetical protein [Bacillus thuringiensis]PED16408.1 hypothetical protein CON01_00735 [Bacillus thuringiensis]PGO85170.1 hypothetical protein CN990_21025 [Bacillus thuringiensis]